MLLLLTVCMCTIVIGIVIVSLPYIFNVKGTSVFQVVVGRSMLPTFQLGDMLVIRNDSGYQFNDVQLGDVIVYRTHDPEFQWNNISTHRVVSMYYVGQEKILVTKGDNNAMPEPLLDYPITQTDYIGKVVYHIPGLGLLRTLSLPNNATNPIDTLPVEMSK